MHDRNIAHFTFDDEAESRRQIAVQEYAVDVTGVVGHDDTAIRGQVLVTSNRDLHSGPNEYNSGGPGDQALPPVPARDDQGHGQANKADEHETQPCPEPPKEISDVCDPVHFMLMPYGFCDGGHARCPVASPYS